MSIPRRTFISGLAAVLSVFRNSGVSAREAMETLKNEFDDHKYDPPIEYLEVGEGEEMLGVSASEPGWYLHSMFVAGYRKSEGPFQSREAAWEADRIRWGEIVKIARSGPYKVFDWEEKQFI
jgi:hypothetical protein